ncbi:MAG: signal peptidase [Rariglobus sp.]|nr:signal peptidase [Rariglobus sp.]
MFFGLFSSVETKMRATAANWLELADKAYHYRRDVLTEAERTALQLATASLRRQLREKSDAGKIKLGIEELEGVLRRTGGTHYPKSGWMENVEFFLVAAIVILGVRMYFVQPFKIPTNSMWPSYNGMTPEVFASKADEPNGAGRALRLVAMGARPRTLDAPVDGEISIPVMGYGDRVAIPFREVAGRNWFIFPAKLKEYTLFVDQRPVTLTVPIDFDFEWVIRDAFLPKTEVSQQSGGVDLASYLKPRRSTIIETQNGVSLWKTGKHVRRGERVLSFDILTGDQLFVDRVSYHFVRPQVGDGFVFRTDHIDSPSMKNRTTGQQLEQYYIKRLAGTPGDTLEIRGTGLYRNGAPITGSKAFGRNATQEGNYPGYQATGLLAEGQTYTVPADSYIALGDNSANSQDSRYWGTVPAKDVVGRPLFIYYTFTRRWGVAP